MKQRGLNYGILKIFAKRLRDWTIYHMWGDINGYSDVELDTIEKSGTKSTISVIIVSLHDALCTCEGYKKCSKHLLVDVSSLRLFATDLKRFTRDLKYWRF